MSVKCVWSACFQGRVSETWSYFLSVCPLRPMSDGGRLEILCCTCTSRRSIHPLEVKVQGKWKYVEGGDKWVMSKLRWTNFLRQFLDIFERVPKTQNFFCLQNLPPCTAKTVFSEPKGPPFRFKEIFFFKSPQIIFLSQPLHCIWSHDSKMV